MSYFLTEDQRMMRDVAAKFAQTELMPIANEIDLSETTPEWVTKRCGELGFLGVFIPEAYGGIGADLTTACLILEEIAKARTSCSDKSSNRRRWVKKRILRPPYLE
mgnify:CR=1 FL=1